MPNAMRLKQVKKILHVDDDEDIVEIARIAFATFGDFEVQHCGSGAEAIEKAPGFLPDLFLLDSRMPGMDGEETWQELKKLPGMEHVPVIFLTARAEAAVADALIEKGAIGVITKPFDPLTLTDLIEEIWANPRSHRNDD